MLATELIEGSAVTLSLAGVGYWVAADLFVGFVFGELAGLVARVSARFAVPGADEVAVTPEGDEGGGAGLDAVAGDEGEVAAGGATDDGDFARIGLKEVRAFFTEPAEGIFDVGDDLGELCFRGEAVVEGHEDVAVVFTGSHEPGGDVFAVAVNQCAAVNPDDDGLIGAIDEAVAVGTDLEVTELFIDVRLFVDARCVGVSHGDLGGVLDDDLGLIANEDDFARDLNLAAVEIFFGLVDFGGGEFVADGLGNEDREVAGLREVGGGVEVAIADATAGFDFEFDGDVLVDFFGGFGEGDGVGGLLGRGLLMECQEAGD